MILPRQSEKLEFLKNNTICIGGYLSNEEYLKIELLLKENGLKVISSEVDPDSHLSLY